MWPWKRGPREHETHEPKTERDQRHDHEIARARAHLDDLKRRALPAADYLDRRRERNHFTEVWQQILGQDPGRTHG